jgi:hypothetical protein
MDLFSAYGSDDDGRDSRDVGTRSREEEQSVEEQSVEEPAARTRGLVRNRRATPQWEKKSRWSASSAFLSPVTFDRDDAGGSDGKESGDEDDDSGTGVERRASRAPGARLGTKALLATLLPAPVNEARDKSAPRDEEYAGDEVETARNDAPNVTRSKALLPINAAPDVRAKRAPNASAPDPIHATGSFIPLPAGAVVREISATALRSQGGGSGDVNSGTRGALGQEYEQKLRADAARVGSVSRLAKRKNQLSSLLVDAKAREIEQLEKSGAGKATRRATQQKYGW